MRCSALESSALFAVGYDAETQLLCVEFRSGAVYDYLGVPQDIHAGLLNAPSKGRYFNRVIRDQFPCSAISCLTAVIGRDEAGRS
jgi:hypothetical protein